MGHCTVPLLDGKTLLIIPHIHVWQLTNKLREDKDKQNLFFPGRSAYERWQWHRPGRDGALDPSSWIPRGDRGQRCTEGEAGVGKSGNEQLPRYPRGHNGLRGPMQGLRAGLRNGAAITSTLSSLTPASQSRTVCTNTRRLMRRLVFPNRWNCQSSTSIW